MSRYSVLTTTTGGDHSTSTTTGVLARVRRIDTSSEEREIS